MDISEDMLTDFSDRSVSSNYSDHYSNKRKRKTSSKINSEFKENSASKRSKKSPDLPKTSKDMSIENQQERNTRKCIADAYEDLRSIIISGDNVDGPTNLQILKLATSTLKEMYRELKSRTASLQEEEKENQELKLQLRKIKRNKKECHKELNTDSNSSDNGLSTLQPTKVALPDYHSTNIDLHFQPNPTSSIMGTPALSSELPDYQNQLSDISSTLQDGENIQLVQLNNPRLHMDGQSSDSGQNGEYHETTQDDSEIYSLLEDKNVFYSILKEMASKYPYVPPGPTVEDGGENCSTLNTSTIPAVEVCHQFHQHTLNETSLLHDNQLPLLQSTPAEPDLMPASIFLQMNPPNVHTEPLAGSDGLSPALNASHQSDECHNDSRFNFSDLLNSPSNKFNQSLPVEEANSEATDMGWYMNWYSPSTNGPDFLLSPTK